MTFTTQKLGRNRRTSGKADWARLYRRPDALQKWGRADGRHIIGVFEDNATQIIRSNMRNTWEELKKRNRPRLTCHELDAVLLESDQV
ncbi:hypothetical protein P7H17_27045 [Paenibacillus larvae]|nr:hypothetical protein [Paenibacillus larvae]MDT2288990.1 hypothetical protein [Paenibacillus larvae]